jgi:hypothetical protein
MMPRHRGLGRRVYEADPRAQRDALIAATAMVHGLTVVTRNVADFEPTGVALLNPWLPRPVEGVFTASVPVLGRDRGGPPPLIRP